MDLFLNKLWGLAQMNVQNVGRPIHSGIEYF